MFKSLIHFFSLLCLSVMLLGCISAPPMITNIDEGYTPYYFPYDEDVEIQQGAIYAPGRELSLFEDMKARRVGDILTVVLVEQTSGQNSSDNSATRSTAVDVTAPSFNNRELPNVGINLNSSNTFSGDSGSAQSNSLSGSISVTVRQVLPNGNLVIQGVKVIQINHGNESIRLQGVIRQKDIDAYNTLYSTQIADARISYTGTGLNSDATKPGWAARLVFSSVWPF